MASFIMTVYCPLDANSFGHVKNREPLGDSLGHSRFAPYGEPHQNKVSEGRQSRGGKELHEVLPKNLWLSKHKHWLQYVPSKHLRIRLTIGMRVLHKASEPLCLRQPALCAVPDRILLIDMRFPGP